MQVFAQLSKVDVEKRLVYGRAAQETPDHSGEVMDYEQSKPNFAKWSDEMAKATGGASQGNIRAMHGQVAAGKVQELIYSDDERAIDVVAKIVDDNEWQKVLEGVYTGFSIGGKYGARVTKGDLRYYEAIPSEISLVDRPCIPTATFFDIQKADGSVMQKQFQSATDLTKGATDMQIEQEYLVEGTAEEADALAKLLSENKLSIGDAVKAMAQVIEAPIAAEIAKRYAGDEIDPEYAASLVALEKVTARADVKFADEKNNKYPIENEAHIRAAWNYINKEKNAGNYSAVDLSTIKDKIVAAWKAKIDKEGPPAAEAAKTEPTGDMKKGIGAVSILGDLLQALYYLAGQCAREAAQEQDGSTVPARLSQVVQDVAGIYKDMAGEEAEELVAEMMESTQPGQIEVMQMAYGLAGSLAKAGARNSAADADMLQKMHDMTGKLGATCKADTTDSAEDTNIQMAQAEPVGDLLKVESLNKMIADAIAPLTKALTDANEKISKLEAMPAPAKGVLRVVSKADDTNSIDVKKVEIAPIIENDGTENSVVTALKKIHSNGGMPLIGGMRSIN